jgi:hypothetical protein
MDFKNSIVLVPILCHIVVAAVQLYMYIHPMERESERRREDFLCLVVLLTSRPMH